MLKKSKWITIICTLVIGVLFVLAVTAVLLISGLFSLNKTDLTFTTESVEALYDGIALTNHSWKMTEGKLKDGHTLKVSFSAAQTAVGESDNALTVKIFDELGTEVTSDYNINYKFGKLKVNPRTLVITSSSETKVYDGQPLVSSDYDISDSCDGLVRGHKASVVVTGYIIDPGRTSNTIETVRIYDELGRDVTVNYQILLREGLLVVDAVGSGTDGPGGSDGPGGPGGPSTGTAGGDISNDGVSSLLPGGANEDMVLFRVLSKVNDHIYLKMQSYGDYTGQGWEEATAYDELLFGEYPASYLTSYAMKNEGATIHSLQIDSLYGISVLPYYAAPDFGDYILPCDDTKFENGDGEEFKHIYGYYRYHTPSSKLNADIVQYERAYHQFVYNHYLSMDDDSLVYMKKLISEQEFSANDPDIIQKVASYIQNAARYNLKYNEALDSEENIAVAFLETYREGVCRHYASAATLLFRALGIPARYTVGFVGQTKANTLTDITAKTAHAWVEVYLDRVGWVMVEVTGSDSNQPEDDLIKISLMPYSVKKQYDGTPFNVSEIEDPKLIGFEAYTKLGYTYEAVLWGTLTEPGKAQSMIESLTIYDPDHNDVTDSFHVTCLPGTIQIYYKQLTFISKDTEMVYNGKQPDLLVDYDRELDSTLHVEITSTANSHVGNSVNSFTVKLTDQNGEDVTDLYWIRTLYGKVTILPCELTVKAGDAQKKYDGTPLSSEEYSFEQGELMEGHRVAVCETVGEQTEIGRSDNIIRQILIVDANGEDVTSNYSIKLLSGKLKVTYQ